MRAGCYARFSSDLQRETSLTDQIATARRYAAAHAWEFVEAQVYTDAAISGSSLERPGIVALRAAAQLRPLPFDVLLVDDSSRVSRDLADAVRLLQELQFAGIRVVYISQNIDSANEQAETLVAVHGVVDSLYLKEMGKKVRRGLSGQLERGYSTGSVTFGYTTVPVPDPSGKIDPSTGFPVLLGKRVQMVPAEADTVVQIFTWYAEGCGVGTILERLHQSGRRGPRGASWKMGAVKRILANERYTGKLIWGQRRFDRRPGTRQKVARPVARNEWTTQERPELRIVSPELWERVQARRAEVRGTLPTSGPTLMRGRCAAFHSRNLFSGFMRCAICGGAVTAVNSGAGSPRYGCSRSHRNGLAACSNRLTIRAKVADPLLLEGLKVELLAPATIRYIADAVAAGINRTLDDRPRLLADAERARQDGRERLQRLVHAIESGVPAATLLSAIREREGEVARLDALVAELSTPVAPRLAIMPGWVRQQLEDIAAVLAENPERTKAKLRSLAVQVTMRPVYDEGTRPFYRATGEALLPWLSGTADLGCPATDRLDRR